MGHVEATIASTLKGTEDSGTSGSSLDTDIKEDLEGSLVFIGVLINVEVLTGNVVVDLVEVRETDLLKQSSSEEETGAVSGGVVGETSGKAVLSELSGLGGTHNLITVHVGVDDLEDELGVGSSDDKSVLLLVVLVLVLADKSTSGEVVGLARSSSSGLGLHARRVSGVLKNLDEYHVVD
jgi:hypothetical protein